MQPSSRLERILGDWGAYVARHRGRVLLGTLLVTLLAAPFAYRAVTHLDANLFNQASDKLVRFRLMRELAEEFGGDILAAVIQIPERHDPAQVRELKAFGSLLAAEMSNVGLPEEDRARLTDALKKELPADGPWLRQVECRTGQGIEQTLRKIVKDRPYVALTPDDVADLKKLFEPENLKQSLERVAATLQDLPPNSAEKVKLQEDPLGLSELANRGLQSRLSKRGSSFASKDPDGYFISKDETMLVVLSRAALPANRLDFTSVLMAAVQRAENRAIANFRKTTPALSTALKAPTFAQLAEPEGQLNVGYTGMPAVTVENEMSLKYDLLGNTATAFVGVLLLFLIVFRRVTLAWDVTWTTAVVILWTLGIAGATKGSISVLGGAFTCILLGTGTDYAIHLHNSYHALRFGEKLSVEEAMRQTLMRCGPGIMTASLTTAIAFFGVTFTSFVGLAEFGLLAGVSVVLGCLMMLLVFPALLCRKESTGSTKKVEPLSLGMPTLGRLLENRAVRAGCAVAGIAVIVFGVLFIQYGGPPRAEKVAGVAFDTDLGNLRSLRIKAIPLRNKLAERFGLGLADVRVVVDAANEELAMAASEEVIRRLEPFVKKGELTPGGNVLDFVPSPRAQQATMDALKNFDVEKATESFKLAATERFGEKGVVFFKPFLRRLHDFGLLTREATPLTLANVMAGPLGGILAPFVSLTTAANKPPRVRLASSWFPSRLDMPAEWYEQIARAVEGAPGASPEGAAVSMTAARMVGFEMKDSLLHDCSWISLIVGIAVVITLSVAFRSPMTSMLAMIPLLYAFLALLAGVTFCQRMGWDFSLNFVNLIMFPLLLGSGIDVGIYMVCDSTSPRRPSMFELMSDTGRSVLCCTLTTLVGYGSFFWSSYTGLISLGTAAIFGYTGALFGALIVLPAVLGLMRKPAPVVSGAAPAAPIAEPATALAADECTR